MKGLEGQQLGSDGLVFLVNSENSSKVAAAQRIVDQLSGAGVSISLERLSWTEYLAALERGTLICIWRRCASPPTSI